MGMESLKGGAGAADKCQHACKLFLAEAAPDHKLVTAANFGVVHPAAACSVRKLIDDQ